MLHFIQILKCNYVLGILDYKASATIKTKNGKHFPVTISVMKHFVWYLNILVKLEFSCCPVNAFQFKLCRLGWERKSQTSTIGLAVCFDLPWSNKPQREINIAGGNSPNDIASKAFQVSPETNWLNNLLIMQVLKIRDRI